MTEPKPMLNVEDLMVFFENAVAVNNVSLEVGEGELVGLLGPNGAGKSTFLYALAGILHDRAVKEARRGGERITVLGSIRLRDLEITDSPPAARVRGGIVLCPERRRVFAESSVLENLRIGAHTQPPARWKAMLPEIWDLFPALYKHRSRPAGYLSGGEQQMLAIARAWMAQPALFLVDEPLLGLAPSIQHDVVQGIQAVRERGATVLVAEQYARAILPIIDRGYVLESGSITFTGTRDELMESSHVRTAYFGL